MRAGVCAARASGLTPGNPAAVLYHDTLSVGESLLQSRPAVRSERHSSPHAVRRRNSGPPTAAGLSSCHDRAGGRGLSSGPSAQPSCQDALAPDLWQVAAAAANGNAGVDTERWSGEACIRADALSAADLRWSCIWSRLLLRLRAHDLTCDKSLFAGEAKTPPPA